MNTPDNNLLTQLLDYLLYKDTPAQRLKTQAMLATDPQARQLYNALESMLSSLDQLKTLSPPPGLADRTMTFIREHRDHVPIPIYNIDKVENAPQAAGSQAEKRGRGRWILTNIKDIIVVAACIGIVLLTAQPGLKHARQRERQIACASQMRQISVALSEYSGDYTGHLPYVRHDPQARWWDVAKQDPMRHSNTRNLFLLVKGGYLSPRVFVCPNVKAGSKIRIQLPLDALQAMSDFDSRDHVTYSFRLMQPELIRIPSNDQPLLTDQNPLFANFNSDLQNELNLQEQQKLLQSNSPNHDQMGQNVLHDDGHILFYGDRTITSTQDDIFTIRAVTRYLGNEKPASDDVFIAP